MEGDEEIEERMLSYWKSVTEAAKMLNMSCCTPIHVDGDMDQALSRISDCVDPGKCGSNVVEVHERQHSVLGGCRFEIWDMFGAAAHFETPWEMEVMEFCLFGK